MGRCLVSLRRRTEALGSRHAWGQRSLIPCVTKPQPPAPLSRLFHPCDCCLGRQFLQSPRRTGEGPFLPTGNLALQGGGPTWRWDSWTNQFSLAKVFNVAFSLPGWGSGGAAEKRPGDISRWSQDCLGPQQVTQGVLALTLRLGQQVCRLKGFLKISGPNL